MRRVIDATARFCGCQTKWGSARMVVVTGRYAFKFARWDLGTEAFRANLRESGRWAAEFAEDHCPVLWTGWFGFLIVMPYARPLTSAEDAQLADDYVSEGGAWSQRLWGDLKAENYGILDGRRVRIDYEGRRFEDRRKGKLDDSPTPAVKY